MVIKIPAEVERQLRNAHYGIFNHSAVQICEWTKKAIRKEDFCYKQKFYGIPCHKCMQFSPASVFCTNRCIFCWRPSEYMDQIFLKEGEVDEPSLIIENLIRLRKQLLSGFGGLEGIDKKHFADALEPSHFAISLSGEPCLYPKLPEMITYLKTLPQTFSIFLVTNAQLPEMLERLCKENALPTQLYISMNAPTEELYRRICNPKLKDFWERFLRSLEIMSKAKTRRIIRLTLIKGFTLDERFLESYLELLKLANPHFVEVKAYMHLGYSQKRLSPNNMPKFEEIKDFSLKLCEISDFELADEKLESRIVLLRNKRNPMERFIHNNLYIPK